MNETIPHLNISTLPNGNLRLENEDINGNDGYIVDVHPIHVRLMAEQLGLVRNLSAAHADIDRTVARLKRRLRVLHERIDRLSDYLLNHSDHRHADLSWETTYCTATLEIADEFVADLDDEASDLDPTTPVITVITPKAEGDARRVESDSTSAADEQGATLPLDLFDEHIRATANACSVT